MRVYPFDLPNFCHFPLEWSKFGQEYDFRPNECTLTEQLLWPKQLGDFVGVRGQSWLAISALIESSFLFRWPNEVFAFNGPGNNSDWVVCGCVEGFRGIMQKLLQKVCTSKWRTGERATKAATMTWPPWFVLNHTRIQWVAQEPSKTSRQSTVGDVRWVV